MHFEKRYESGAPRTEETRMYAVAGATNRILAGYCAEIRNFLLTI